MVFVRELKASAKQCGLHGYSRMRKAELIHLLGLEYNKPQTVRELKAQAKKSGLRGYSRMRKAELIPFLDNNKSVGDVDKPTVVDNNELKFVPQLALVNI